MKPYEQMLVMGAGAVGGYFGGRVAEKTSASVAFIARGAHLQAMQQQGLQLKSPDGNARIPVEAFKHPPKNLAPDLILFTVKSFDTEDAIETIRPVVGAHTQILTIQNGIENYPKLTKAFGRERVIQGFCKIGAGIAEPGVINHKAFGKITVGEKDGSTTNRLEKLKALFEEADIPLHITGEIDRKVWLKFAWNGVFNMLTAAADVTVERLFEYKETEQLCYRIFNEIQQVAEKEGIPLTPNDAEDIIEPARKLEGFTTSTYQDRQKGKKLEYDAFTGAILRLAKKHNGPVPYNEMLYGMLKLIDNS